MVTWSLLLAIGAVVLGVSVRLLGILDETLVHEYDPHYNLSVTRMLTDKDYLSVYDTFDAQSWYPFGRAIGKTTYPGLMIATSTLRNALSALGVSLPIDNVAALMGLLTLGLTVYSTTQLGRYAVDRESQPLYSLFVTILSIFHVANLRRTVAGSYDNECLFLPLFALFTLLYPKARNDGCWRTFAKAILVFWGMQCTSGSFLYVLVVVQVYHCIESWVERPTHSSSVRTRQWMSVILTLSVVLFGQTMQIQRRLVLLGGEALIAHTLLLASFCPLPWLSCLVPLAIPILVYLPNLSLRAVSILFPWLSTSSSALVTSISEHRPMTWAFLAIEHHLWGLLVALAGMIEAASDWNHRRTAYPIPILFHLVVFAVTAYSAGLMSRLSALMTPSLAVLGAFALTRAWYRHGIISRVIILAGLIHYTFHGIMMTSQFLANPSIYQWMPMSDGTLKKIDDFRAAYTYLGNTYPRETRVMMWWDYGYQLQFYSGLTTFVDNNTRDGRHISRLALALVLSPPESSAVARELDVDVTCVVQGGSINWSGDDLSKLPWMEKMVREEFELWYHREELSQFIDPKELLFSPSHRLSTLFNLLYRGAQFTDYLRGALSPNIEPSPFFDHVYDSPHRLVRCYELHDPMLPITQWSRLRWNWTDQPGIDVE